MPPRPIPDPRGQPIAVEVAKRYIPSSFLEAHDLSILPLRGLGPMPLFPLPHLRAADRGQAGMITSVFGAMFSLSLVGPP